MELYTNPEGIANPASKRITITDKIKTCVFLLLSATLSKVNSFGNFLNKYLWKNGIKRKKVKKAIREIRFINEFLFTNNKKISTKKIRPHTRVNAITFAFSILSFDSESLFFILLNNERKKGKKGEIEIISTIKSRLVIGSLEIKRK